MGTSQLLRWLPFILPSVSVQAAVTRSWLELIRPVCSLIYIYIYILGRYGIYFTWVAASYRGEARGLWINASPRERSLVRFHLSEFRIWKGFSPWGNRGSVACQLLQMKTSTTHPQAHVASQHLDGMWTRRPSPLPTVMLVWYGEQPQGITPLAGSWGRTQDLPRGQPMTWPLGHESCS